MSTLTLPYAAATKTTSDIMKTSTYDEQNVAKTANQLSTIEDDLINAYGGDPTQMKKLAEKYNLKKEGKPLSDESIQSVLNLKFQRAQRAFTSLMNTLNSANEMMMKVINMIRG